MTTAFFVPSKEAGDMVSAVVLRLAEEAEVSASSGAGSRAGVGAGAAPEAGDGAGEGRGDEGYYEGGDEYMEEVEEPAVQVSPRCSCFVLRVCVRPVRVFASIVPVRVREPCAGIPCEHVRRECAYARACARLKCTGS